MQSIFPTTQPNSIEVLEAAEAEHDRMEERENLTQESPEQADNQHEKSKPKPTEE
jgi:hypothetical protein